MSRPSLLLTSRGSSGIDFIHGPPQDGIFPGFPSETSSLCREMTFAQDGSLFAWVNGQKVNILSTSSFKLLHEIEKPRTTCLAFSPKGTYLATWEPYVVKETPQLSCNLHIWNTSSGECVKSFIQKKQTNWYPAWTEDEKLSARCVSNEVHFYEAENFDNIVKKIYMQKVSAFSLAPGPPSYHIACYVPGVKGQPSFVRLFKYPQFEGTSAVIAQKSFYKADRADFFWNAKGSDLIVQAVVDVDKSGASYYGEQNLYYLSVKGETARVMLGKEGPVYAVQWDPDSNSFCVVYGFMPAKATIYNLKCEPVFDFGAGPRNEVHYTPTGNRLILCGFGNLRGHVEVWDLKDFKKISTFVASDSTVLQWSPDGEYILTATTSPRIRIGNGYRIWHYTGSLLREVFIEQRQEIWEMKWMPIPVQKLQVKPTNYTPVPGIQSLVAQASKQVYRPPSARGQPSSFKLHDDESSKSATDKNAAQPMSKNKKKNLARKAKKEQGKMDDEKVIEEIQPVSKEEEPESNPAPPAAKPKTFDLTGDPEKDKRIRNLLKKLDQIEKLRQDQASGKQLEKNQIEKMKKEKDIVEELEALQL